MILPRSLAIAFASLLLALPAVAQVAPRSEFAPYQLRRDAASRSHQQGTPSYIEFIPMAVATSFGEVTREQRFEVTQEWVDATAYLHLENVGSAYTLSINGSMVVECEDSFTPTTYTITPYLKGGENVISLTTRPSKLPQIEAQLPQSSVQPLAGSYIFTQNKLRILDYQAVTIPLEQNTDVDELGAHGQLLLDVVVENGFNYPETIEVGFDIYDPTGKLLDFSTAKATIEAGSIDTIRFSPHLYGAAKYRWNPDAAVGMQVIGRPTTRYTDQQLYSVMIFTKRTGLSSGYIPFEVGFTSRHYADGVLSQSEGGAAIALRSRRYNALGDKELTEKELRAIKAEGVNTISPDYPQPLWFYSLCDKVGLYVIEQAAINASGSSSDKAIGGTPSNDPALLDEYMARVQRMYYRTRNFSCVVAYSLGSEAGNGFNMYRAYRWLKEVEPNRPIIYQGAAGEWNSDNLKIEER